MVDEEPIELPPISSQQRNAASAYWIQAAAKEKRSSDNARVFQKPKDINTTLEEDLLELESGLLASNTSCKRPCLSCARVFPLRLLLLIPSLFISKNERGLMDVRFYAGGRPSQQRTPQSINNNIDPTMTLNWLHHNNNIR